jgi:S-sulfo-L-cysteine synthase (O-acetyl-L-serine-dependent)
MTSSRKPEARGRAGTTRAGLSGGNLDDWVGDTPLVELRRVGAPGGAPVHVKLEGRNPGGSVKDRPALAILRDAERRGLVGPGRVLLDASSGNTGIAYAMLCAARGYGCEICLPATASAERKQLLVRYGASVVITDPAEGSDGAIREARRRAKADPERYFFADQYNNPANVRAHYETTGPEIWSQTGGRITHLVVGLGTSGTFVGAGTRLRELAPRIRLVAVQPDSPFHGLEGLKHMESAIVPGIYRPELAWRTLPVATEEAQAMARRLAREEGLLTGVSVGANVAASLRVAQELGPGALVVTLLPDGGERYLNEPWWEEEP